MIHGVTGPDEYENNVDNNWYTNILAQWTLKYTLEILNKVSPEQAKKLNVSDAEKKQWQDIVDKMYLPYDKDLNIFVQHDGFLDKDLKPVSEIPADQLPINQHWSWDKILRSPYIKQGDVLQGIWTLSTTIRQNRRKLILISTKSTLFMNQACHQPFIQCLLLILAMRTRPWNCMNGRRASTLITITTIRSTACTLLR